MKNTKIIATIGSNSSSIEVLKNIIQEGADVIRIDLTYSQTTFCDEIIEKIRFLEKELNKPIGIMLDIKGPCIKLDELKEGKSYLTEDKELKIYNYHVICNNTQLSLNNSSIVDMLKIDDTLLFANSKASVKVIDKKKDYVVCQVISGGDIYSRQTLHLKDRNLNLTYLSEDDIDSIMYAIKRNIDFLALSCVRSEQDVLEVIDMLIENGNDHMQVIAKIENAKAIENLEEITKASDGVMIARGDLSVEMSIEKLPFYQKNILTMAHRYQKLSIVATDLLTSMGYNNYPSRAEVSDIYNAVISKCDALLLSYETTVGNYPIETVRAMAKILESAEEDFDYIDNLQETMRDTKQNITSSIAYSVVHSSIKLNASAIIANTNSGWTAKLISYFRPKCPIVGLSPSIDTVRSLTLVYGVMPLLSEECQSTDGIVKMCLKEARQKLDLEHDNIVIITGGFPISNKNTNFMKIEVID